MRRAFMRTIGRWMAKHPWILAAAAFLYVLSPLDVLPEIIAGPAGYLDDVLLAAVLGTLLFGKKEAEARPDDGVIDVEPVRTGSAGPGGGTATRGGGTGTARKERSMDGLFAALGAAALFSGVALGAFAAHGLKGRLSPEMLAIFQTGVQYHLIHGLGLFAAAWASVRFPGGLAVWAGYCLTAGIVVFSGSLYVLSLTGVRLWGSVTPVGGLFFLAGWALLFLTALRR